MICVCVCSCLFSRDGVKVYDGGDVTGPVIAHLCDSTNHVEIWSSSSTLLVEFFSDSEKTHDGFEARFHFLPASTPTSYESVVVPEDSEEDDGSDPDDEDDDEDIDIVFTPPPARTQPPTSTVSTTTSKVTYLTKLRSTTSLTEKDASKSHLTAG